ncbi:MAG: hypothetical protein ACK40X_05440, partial [Armatimonadota bacterium]
CKGRANGHIKVLSDIRGKPKGVGQGVPFLRATKALCSSDKHSLQGDRENSQSFWVGAGGYECSL